jgi:hypothetical protein
MQYLHHPIRRAKQRPGQYTLPTMKGLSVPVNNAYGLRFADF